MSAASEAESITAKLGRAERRATALEAMLEARTREAHLANEQLRATTESLLELFRAVPGAIFVFGADRLIEAVNGETLRLLEYTEPELIGSSIEMLFPATARVDIGELERLAAADQLFRGERELRTKAGRHVPVLLSATRLESGEHVSLVCVAVDLTERKRLETELLQAQKLESIGRLAAGIAHEVNTPIQFVSDSVRFAREAVTDLAQVFAGYTELRMLAAGGEQWAEKLRSVERLEHEVEVDYLFEQLPGALDRAQDGLNQVAAIVRATKDFAYPTTRDRRLASLNKALVSTLSIARSEYSAHADVQLDLGELPLVPCHVGELNQVFLNLIVNAAHSIADRPAGGRGCIVIRTWLEDEKAYVRIADDGHGIPVAIQERIFEPFFTTKEVGRGTGQGLALSRAVVVDRHGGQLTFESEEGIGTAFTISLPLAPQRASSSSALAAVESGAPPQSRGPNR